MMTIQDSNHEPPDLASQPAPDEDPTGQARMTRNIMASWAAHLLTVIGGFVLPRMIDRGVGQESLGIWDFAWSLVAYFSLLRMGVVTSVNRFVARYRAVGDTDRVNCAVSSVSCVLGVVGLAVGVLTVLAALLVPGLLRSQLAEHVRSARWLIGLLGCRLLIEISLAGFGGVLSGCHRWFLKNAIEAGLSVATVAGMIASLLLGGGLISLGWIALCGQAVGGIALVASAYRVCPALEIRLAHARWSEARGMLGFGGKSFVYHISPLLLNQTVNLMILGYLGPSALAVFSRPRSLVRQGGVIMRKFASVLTPTTSSLQAMGCQEDIRDLFVRATRYAAYIALPIVLTMTILGGAVLRVWMGPAYESGKTALAILAAGNLLFMIQRPVRNILAGLNAHGWPGVVSLVAAAGAAPLAYLALGPLQWGLAGAAGAIALALGVSNGVYMPIYACRRLDMSYRKYVVNVMAGPMACTAPFGLCLLTIRWLFPDQPGMSLLYAAGAGAIALGPLYWRYALPAPLKHSLKARIGWKRQSDVREATTDRKTPDVPTPGPAEAKQNTPSTKAPLTPVGQHG